MIKTRTPWNKGKTGLQVAWNKGLSGYMSGVDNGKWKGDNISYSGVHKWVQSVLGRPAECENCGTIEAKMYEWSNISGEYKRDISDWARLCVRCHRLIDNWYDKVGAKRNAIS